MPARRHRAVRGFIMNDAVTSPLARAIMERVAPHVGQGIPVNILKAQDGIKESAGIVLPIKSIIMETPP